MEHRRVDVSIEVADAHHWQAALERQSLGKAHPHQQSPDQAGPPGDSNQVNLGQPLVCPP